MIKNKYHYMNPYIAGVLLGMVLIMAFYFSGHGIGASGAVKSVVVDQVVHIMPTYAENSAFLKKYVGHDTSPFKSWMFLEILGVLLGGFLSGAISGRLHFEIEKTPQLTNKKRLLIVLVSGVIVGIGTQFARGCASGAAMSGMVALSVTGFVTFFVMFATAFVVARLVKKIWIKKN